MKIIIAPQSFKGSLSAPEAARAMALGVGRVLPDAEMVLVPMADGGEGTVEALVDATGGRMIKAEVTGPLGERVKAGWGILGDGVTAVIEMAAASGITLIPPQRLNPLVATTFGTGELIREALDNGCRKLLIGIGGSGTNDGGAGMVQALGVSLLNDRGKELLRGGAALAKLAKIDMSGLDSRLAECQIEAAYDVNNPLCGESGASMVYGPQKGATAEMARQLDSALAHYAKLIESTLGVDVMNLPGAGAAGGMGAGLAAFLGARLLPGMDIVSEAVGLEERLRGASLVLTGEGRIDGQTLFGKVVAGVAARAKALNVPVVAIVGEIAGGGEVFGQGIDAVLSIVPGPISLERALSDGAELVSDATERALRLIMIRLDG
ncbi:MAG TPA: glycerate kinase [Dehalococcoidia bacterium]|nr:glycerate kinase [Dehalococcoidia bacterium]